MPRLTRADLELPPAFRAPFPPRGTPIMLLSYELHVRIATSLKFPDNMSLKLMSRYFYQLVPPMNLEQLKEAELSVLCIRNRVLGCSSCLRLRKPLNFSDDTRMPPSTVTGHRTCIDCGAQRRYKGFKPGDMISWDEYRHIMCDSCEEFKTSGPRKALGLCQKCWDYSAKDGGTDRQFWDRRFNSKQLKAIGSVRLHHGLVCQGCYRDLDKCPSVQACLDRLDRSDLCRLCLVKTFGCCPRNHGRKGIVRGLQTPLVLC